METKKLSEYMDTMFNAVYLHPKRTAKTIDENIKSEDGDLFGVIFPLPNYYGYIANENGFKVSHYEGRNEAADAKKSSKEKMETHRDYLILDIEKFEEWLTERSQDLKRRMPAGFKSPTATQGYLDAEALMSLTTEEARKEYAAQIAQRLDRPKRKYTEAQRKAAAERMQEFHKKQKK